MGFSRKRFLVTLGLSILIVLSTSYFGQLYDREDWKLNWLSLSSCAITGYPLKICLYSPRQGLLISILLINIAFWFLVINFLYSAKKILIGMGAFLIWIITVIIQKQTAIRYCLGDVSWFRITGYPIAECVSKQDKDIIFTVYLVNIAFWFLAVYLIILLMHKLLIRFVHK